MHPNSNTKDIKHECVKSNALLRTKHKSMQAAHRSVYDKGRKTGCEKPIQAHKLWIEFCLTASVPLPLRR